MFSGVGLPELVIILVILCLIIIPAIFVSRILGKAGFSPWLAILSIIPLVNLIFLWVFAFIDWPGVDSKIESRS